MDYILNKSIRKLKKMIKIRIARQTDFTYLESPFRDSAYKLRDHRVW